MPYFYQTLAEKFVQAIFMRSSPVSWNIWMFPAFQFAFDELTDDRNLFPCIQFTSRSLAFQQAECPVAWSSQPVCPRSVFTYVHRYRVQGCQNSSLTILVSVLWLLTCVWGWHFGRVVPSYRRRFTRKNRKPSNTGCCGLVAGRLTTMPAASCIDR